MLDRALARSRKLRALSHGERRTLKALGVRFGAFSLYLPALATSEAQRLGEHFATLARPGWRPALDALSPLPHPRPPPEALALRALRIVGGLVAPVAALERLDALAREAEPHAGGAIRLTPELIAAIGWKPGQAEQILRGLGFAPARKRGDVENDVWRRRATREADAAGPVATPFAALAPFAKPKPPRRRVRRKRSPRGQTPREARLDER